MSVVMSSNSKNLMLCKITVSVSKRTFFTFKPKQDSSENYKYKEKKFLSPIYDPLPIVIASGEGCHVWDIEGKVYLDFLAGLGNLILGHSHNKILREMRNQSCLLTLTSRHVYNNVLPDFAEFATRFFDYDMVIPLNSGPEAGEVAVKIARKWGYVKKSVKKDCALIAFPENNYWGSTTAGISTSSNPALFENFGPYMTGFGLIPYNDINCLKTILSHPNMVAFFMEPILVDGGVIVPCDGYLEQIRKLCSDNNVLWIADETRTGMGRTGALLAVDHECVRPDLVLIGGGLAAGTVPMAAVFGYKPVMSLMTTGTHRSSFGGNPLACKIALKTMEIVQSQNLMKNACEMGKMFRKLMECTLPSEIVVSIRGRGLLTAIQLNPSFIKAREFCILLLEEGLLAQNLDDCTVRLTPPLIIKEAEIKQAANIIHTVIQKIRGCM